MFRYYEQFSCIQRTTQLCTVVHVQYFEPNGNGLRGRLATKAFSEFMGEATFNGELFTIQMLMLHLFQYELVVIEMGPFNNQVICFMLLFF